MSTFLEPVLIVGAGVFGLTAALELRRRGFPVRVMDPGPVPHPLASSNDTSRMVRMDYGDDELYVELARQAIQGWHTWNERWGETVYHEDGVLMASSLPMSPGAFEYDSFTLLSDMGYNLQRLDSEQIAQRYPLWNAQKYVDGYYNPRAGWVEAAKVVTWLAAEARAIGIEMLIGDSISGLLTEGSRTTGVMTSGGDEILSNMVVLATGAWTPTLIPSLADVMQTVGQPIYYLQPSEPELFRGPAFPPWAADIPRSGWYGFPANQDGIVKIANHGPGRIMKPEDSRDLIPAEIDRFKEFIQETIPALADAPMVNSRVCLYCDTWDGNFWIGHDPELQGLVVAAGGSGHAFKFAPILGGIIADTVEGVDTLFTQRFAWRPRGEAVSEAIRYTGE